MTSLNVSPLQNDLNDSSQQLHFAIYEIVRREVCCSSDTILSLGNGGNEQKPPNLSTIALTLSHARAVSALIF
jgi:hypothetical protein